MHTTVWDVKVRTAKFRLRCFPAANDCDDCTFDAAAQRRAAKEAVHSTACVMTLTRNLTCMLPARKGLVLAATDRHMNSLLTNTARRRGTDTKRHTDPASVVFPHAVVVVVSHGHLAGGAHGDSQRVAEVGVARALLARAHHALEGPSSPNCCRRWPPQSIQSSCASFQRGGRVQAQVGHARHRQRPARPPARRGRERHWRCIRCRSRPRTAHRSR
jgi:hypothetical protein